MTFKTVIEPFRIKVVEPIRRISREERLEALKSAGYNLFLIKAEDVLIDLLTDSGTGAMSSHQWSGMMLGDESYAGSSSFYKFEKTVKDITGFKHILPAHQGRAAERILFGSVLHPGDIVPNNNHFDTTRANIEYQKASACDIPNPEGKQIAKHLPFKGNMDLSELEKLLKEKGDNIPLVMITVTNNSGGGQPVSMENIREAGRLCHKYGKPLFLDACRFAENSWFIKTREKAYADKSPIDIAREMFGYADGCTMSAKKDGIANIGGFLAMNNDEWAKKCKDMLILTEGFPTYGGLAGYDLEAIAVGLYEALDEEYLRYRIQSISDFGAALSEIGIPILQPPGGHAIYLDAKSFLPHIPQKEYPAWALSLVLYLEGGIRSVAIGSVMFGRQPDGSEKPASMELVRLAFPRRVYTKSHIDYVTEVLSHVYAVRERVRGVKIVSEPLFLRHFTAEFIPAHGDLILQ